MSGLKLKLAFQKSNLSESDSKRPRSFRNQTGGHFVEDARNGKCLSGISSIVSIVQGCIKLGFSPSPSSHEGEGGERMRVLVDALSSFLSPLVPHGARRQA